MIVSYGYAISKHRAASFNQPNVFQLMHLFAYTSRFAGIDSCIDREVRSILETSRRNNSKHEITGVIFQQRHRFLQFLEGSRDSVESLMSVIAQDPRHSDLEILFDDPIPNRGFPDWSMGHLNLDPEVDLSSEHLRTAVKTYRSNCRVDSSCLVNVLTELIPFQVGQA